MQYYILWKMGIAIFRKYYLSIFRVYKEVQDGNQASK